MIRQGMASFDYNDPKRSKTESESPFAAAAAAVSSSRRKSLLIIDPQSDFSDAAENIRDKNGALMVPGASRDYSRIIQYLRSDPEVCDVHVSLDTHTDRHIGHPGFWEVKLEETSEWEPATDENSGLTILKIDADNKISGSFNLVAQRPIYQFRPRCYDPASYPALCRYVNEYLHFYDQDADGKFKPENKKGQFAWIWFNHCLEETEGHRVAVELQAELNTFAAQPGKKVYYHIKGQNNLAEMYSIFSAERPVADEWQESLRSYMYTGSQEGHYYDNRGKESYEAVRSSRNLNTRLNTELMDILLGITPQSPAGVNTVVVCGQARTHCVKSSKIDLMAYARQRGVASDRLIFMQNCSSPIAGVPDDLADIVREQGYTVDENTFGI